jgi:hypothetical protein
MDLNEPSSKLVATVLAFVRTIAGVYAVVKVSLKSSLRVTYEIAYVWRHAEVW